MTADTQLLVSTEEDKDLLENSQMSWDDLNNLKENVGHEIMKLTVRISTLIGQRDFVTRIPVEHRSRVAVVVETIMSDLEHYSSMFKRIRNKHEHRSGKFQTIEEFEEFNAVSMEYLNLGTQLMSVLAPLFSELTLLIPETSSSNQGAHDEQVQPH